MLYSTEVQIDTCPAASRIRIHLSGDCLSETPRRSWWTAPGIDSEILSRSEPETLRHPRKTSIAKLERGLSRPLSMLIRVYSREPRPGHSYSRLLLSSVIRVDLPYKDPLESINQSIKAPAFNQNTIPIHLFRIYAVSLRKIIPRG